MEIKKASSFKRVCAAIMDLLLAFLLGSLISSFICSPIANNVTDIVESRETFNGELFDLGYYVIAEIKDKKYEIVADFESENKDDYKDKVNNNKNYIYVSLVDSEITISNEKFDHYLTHFYQEIEALDVYNKYKEEKTDLFEKVDENIVIKENASEEDLKNFYSDIYTTKILSEEKLLSYDNQRILKLSQHIDNITRICAYIGIFISLLLLNLCLPLIFKNGQTIGKKMMNLGVVNVTTGESASKLALFLRFVTYALVEIFLSLMIIYIPLIISFIIMLVNKKGQSVHDLVAHTTVIDLFEANYVPEKDESVIEVDAKDVENKNNENNNQDEDNKEQEVKEIEQENASENLENVDKNNEEINTDSQNTEIEDIQKEKE